MLLPGEGFVLRLCSGGRWRLESFTSSQGHGIIRLFHRIRLMRNLNRIRALGITWGRVIRILIPGLSEIRPTREMGPGDMFAQPISESYNWVRISVKCDFLVPGHQGNWGPPLELVCMSGVGVGVGVRVVCTGVYGSGLARWERENVPVGIYRGSHLGFQS